MSLLPQPLGEIPELTARIARAAFPKGSVVMRLRDEFGRLYDDEDFRTLFSTRGRPALPPWRLALVTVLQFMEHLSDRQAAEMLRARIDWKYALSLELDDPGFHFSVVATLRKVWSLHFIRQDSRVVWRAPKTLPPVGERLQSPYDPEMHYSTKRNLEWSGYKVHFTESCDQDTVHLITHVHTTPAMAYDGSSTAVIHQKLADKGLAPAEHYVDSAYVDAELLVTSQRDHGIQLMGPIRQSSSWQTRMGQGYDLPHFQVDWEREQVTCPQGKTSVSWQQTKRRDAQGEPPRIAVRFGRADCGPCVARSLCTPAKEARRAVYLHLRDEYEALRAARMRMHDPVWKVQYQVRAGIEGTLSQGVRAFGVRRSRYVGLAKTGLHEVLAATGINALRVADWLRSKPRAKTRVSPFVALGAVA